MSKFTDIEVATIKRKMNQKFDKALIATLMFLPLILLISPYIPGRRGRGPMIERMPYWEAVLKMSVVWILVLIGVRAWHYFNSHNQFSKNRKFLRKKKVGVEIVDKSKGYFSSFENSITTDWDDLGDIKVEKEVSNNLRIGDRIEVEYEEHTKAIFNIEKTEDRRDNN